MKENSKTVSVLFMLFGILFCVCLITANVLETKQISVGSISLTGGLMYFQSLTSSTTAYVKCGDMQKLAY